MSGTYESLKALLLKHEGRVMSNAERRAQAISFVWGQMALMSQYRDATPEGLEALRELCTDTVDRMHPEWLE